MLTEEKVLGAIDIENTLKTISIALDTVVLRDGKPIAKTRHRCAFVPGELDKVVEYTGLSPDSPEITYISAIWSPEVIDTYLNKVALIND